MAADDSHDNTEDGIEEGMFDEEPPLQDQAAEREKGADEMFCSSCGAIIKQEAEICPECGVRQKSNSEVRKSKTTAGLLALFLGGAGAHKFYLGQWKMGFLYLLFIWTFIPAIIALYEAIQYFRASDEEFQEQYVRQNA